MSMIPGKVSETALRTGLRERMQAMFNHPIQAEMVTVHHVRILLEAEFDTELSNEWIEQEMLAYIEELKNNEKEARLRELKTKWGITSDVPIIIKKFKKYGYMQGEGLIRPYKSLIRPLVDRIVREIKEKKRLKEVLKRVLGKGDYRKYKVILIKKFKKSFRTRFPADEESIKDLAETFMQQIQKKRAEKRRSAAEEGENEREVKSSALPGFSG